LEVIYLMTGNPSFEAHEVIMHAVAILVESFHKMKATLEMHGGMSLAANQIGRQEAVCIIKGGDEPVITLVNPVITQREGSQRGVEECLSQPGIFVTVTRPQEIYADQLWNLREVRDLLAGDS
jgi:peptide deformylase